MTGNDIINEALLLSKRITPGQTASTDEIATCKLALNSLLGEWNAQSLAIYSVAPKVFNLSSGTADYTIGTGGTFNTARPVKIEAWNVKTTSGQANGGIPMDAATFAEVSNDRSAQGSRVKALNYDAAYPLGSIHVWPKPSGGVLEIWVWDALPVITDFTLTLDYPPGYLQAIVFNLAVSLNGKWIPVRGGLDPNVTAMAAESKQALVSSNQSQHRAPAPQGAA